MVQAENKYEVHLLDEENAWGKPTEEQEKIVTMSTEINLLKKEHRSSMYLNMSPKNASSTHARC